MASYVKVPDFETTPMFPFLQINPGIIPSLHSSTVIIPGQLGPTKRVPFRFMICLTFTISCIGTPSVMQTMSSIPA